LEKKKLIAIKGYNKADRRKKGEGEALSCKAMGSKRIILLLVRLN
jgi:hypothetical protein